MKRKKSNIKLIPFLFIIILVIGTIVYTFSLNKNDSLCKNKKIFLGIKETLKIIELESYNQLKEEILTEISIKLNKETCCDENEFLLKSGNSLTGIYIFFSGLNLVPYNLFFKWINHSEG